MPVPKTRAQVHRFGDLVALALEDAPTVYYSALDAARIGAAITKAAREIKNHVPFGDSAVGTFTLGDAHRE